MVTILKKDYNYNPAFAEIDRKPMHLPNLKNLIKREIDVKKYNHILNNKDYDINDVRIWIKQFPTYEQKFKRDIVTSKKLRARFSKNWQDSESYIKYIYEEYTTWLTYMDGLNLSTNTEIKQLKKYFLSFFSKHNNAYYLNVKQQKDIRQYNYKLNPFINFWFDCQALSQGLQIPRFTKFLPKIPVLYSTIIKQENKNNLDDTKKL